MEEIVKLFLENDLYEAKKLFKEKLDEAALQLVEEEKKKERSIES